MKQLFSKLIIIIFVLISINSNLLAQQIISIGSGNATNSNLPFHGYYNNSWTAAIYKQSEMMGIVGSIESISFHVSNTLSNYSMFNQKIYITTIPDSSFSSLAYIDPTTINAQLVYDDSILWNAGNQGWYELVLSNPFIYVGGNLLILWENRDGSWSSSYPSFYHTNSPESNMSKFNNEDASFPLTDGSYELSRPNIKMNLSYLDTNNIRIDELLSPIQNSIPSVNQLISIGIENYSINPQDSFIVQYSIDGGSTFVSEVCLDTIEPYDTLVYNFLALADMSNIALYNCIFIVSNTGDTVNSDDTLVVDIWKGDVFHGNYTIGNSTVNDFNTISSACRALENFGVSDSTIFVLSSDTFHEQVKLQGPISGSTPENKIVFIGQGNNTIVTDTTNSLNPNIFSIIGTKNIVIDSLSIESVGLLYNCGIRIIASDSIVIKNCNISVPINIDTVTTNAIIVSNSLSLISNTNASNIVIENNRIHGGYYGVGLFGKSLNHSKDIRIINNEIEDYYYFGIYSKAQDSINIVFNEISDRGMSDNGYGIYISESRLGSNINSNNIKSNFILNGIGMYLGHCKASSINPFYIVNNMVVSTQATVSPNGIHSYYGKHLRYFYNSVSINKGGFNSRVINVNGGLYSSSFADIQFVNNNIANLGDGYSFYFEDDFYPTKVTVCNYNNLFAEGLKYAHYVTDKNNLASWQASSQGIDSNSLAVNPLFISPVDLHTFSVQLNGKASSSIIISNDIDVEQRDTLFPDIGADEYTPTDMDVGIVAILSDINPYCLITNDTINVVVKNYGTENQSNILVHLEINSALGVVIFTDSVDSLESWESDTLFMGVIASGAAGIYEYKAYTNLWNDTINTNDTLNTFIEVYAADSIGYFEDFTSWPPEKWDTIVNSDFMWKQYDTSIVYADFSVNSQREKCEFFSPSIEIPLNSVSYLGFQYSYFFNQNNVDSLEVLMKLCNSDEWVTMWKEGGNSLNTVGSNDSLVGPFQDVLITIPIFARGENARFMFRGTSYSGSKLFLQGMTVFLPPDINLGSDTAVCESSNYTIGVDNLFGATYLWYRDGDSIASSRNYVVDSTGSYYFEVHQFGFSDYDTINVEYFYLPIVNIGDDTTINWVGASITLDAGNPDASWFWSTGSTNQTETFDTLNLNNGTDNLVFVEVTKDICTTTDFMTITVTNNISIRQITKDNSINIFPNPNNGSFNVLINGEIDEFSIDILNCFNQIVYRSSISNEQMNKIDLGLQNISSGVYFIKVYNDNELMVKRIIIR
ncbi:MAG: hypothetical protein DRI86_08320 [Bacteroidetes bacterium]|nr:MAG: hypothetical protein DRI86_08320 [Bacteroidota bacterium]